jgi:hypothetical protein
MPAPNAEAEPFRPGTVELAHGTCGYQWTNDTACGVRSAHTCSRIRMDHRSHLCSCQAVELRTATHLRAASRPAVPATPLDPTPTARPEMTARPVGEPQLSTVDMPHRRR